MIKRIPFLLALLWVAGCGHAPSLIGSWQSQIRNISLSLNFNPDGTLSGKGSFKELSLDLKGTYTFDGHVLDYEITDAEPEGTSFNPMLLAAAASASRMSDSGNLEWKNQNEFILTNKRGIRVPFLRIGGNRGA
ncbi:MAG TPA: hypothetical protein VGL56_14805 [Fimbriimonadaceae bacterium]|jgi:hypothetical protein